MQIFVYLIPFELLTYNRFDIKIRLIRLSLKSQSDIEKWKKLFVGTVPMNKKLFVGTVPMNNKLFVRTVPMDKKLFVGTFVDARLNN